MHQPDWTTRCLDTQITSQVLFNMFLMRILLDDFHLSIDILSKADHHLQIGKQQKQCQTLCVYFLSDKITTDGDSSHEIKRHLLLGRKVMTNLESILKSTDITLPTKVHLVKVMVFPVVMYGCKSWTVKKAEHRRIDTFELWYWRRLLRVPWTARRSNQSILKEIIGNSWYSLEGLMLMLKLQYFGHLM